MGIRTINLNSVKCDMCLNQTPWFESDISDYLRRHRWSLRAGTKNFWACPKCTSRPSHSPLVKGCRVRFVEDKSGELPKICIGRVGVIEEEKEDVDDQIRQFYVKFVGRKYPLLLCIDEIKYVG